MNCSKYSAQGKFTELINYLPDYCEILHKESSRCPIDEMPVTLNFDPDRFAGEWYSYAQFKESSSLDANSLSVMNNQGQLKVISAGQR